MPTDSWEAPHLAFRRSLRRLLSTRRRRRRGRGNWGMSMALLLPKYQFCVMFSVDTTSARLFGYTCSERITLQSSLRL